MNQIVLNHVSFQYPNGFLANEDINLVINQEEQVAIVGQNGAGKTTVVKLMNGLNKPTVGDVTINGMNTKEYTTAQIARYVGYVFQNPDDQIFNTTVRAELEFWPRYQKLSPEDMNARVARAAEMTGIGQYMELNPYEIPYSTKKFVSIAAILADALSCSGRAHCRAGHTRCELPCAYYGYPSQRGQRCYRHHTRHGICSTQF